MSILSLRVLLGYTTTKSGQTNAWETAANL